MMFIFPICLLLSVNHLSVNIADSPGVPPSANAHQLFKGFSFVAPFLLEDQVDGLEMGSHHSEKSTSYSKVKLNLIFLYKCVEV